jgi:hypothetical protein
MQGHSKNPAGDDCVDLITILAEVFAGFRHGHAAGADEIEDKVADRCECARGSDPRRMSHRVRNEAGSR